MKQSFNDLGGELRRVWRRFVDSIIEEAPEYVIEDEDSRAAEPSWVFYAALWGCVVGTIVVLLWIAWLAGS